MYLYDEFSTREIILFSTPSNISENKSIPVAPRRNGKDTLVGANNDDFTDGTFWLSYDVWVELFNQVEVAE